MVQVAELVLSSGEVGEVGPEVEKLLQQAAEKDPDNFEHLQVGLAALSWSTTAHLRTQQAQHGAPLSCNRSLHGDQPGSPMQPTLQQQSGTAWLERRAAAQPHRLFPLGPVGQRKWSHLEAWTKCACYHASCQKCFACPLSPVSPWLPCR